MGTTLRQTRVIRYSPAGLSDSLDETDEFPGAMALLQNLVPDPSTRNVWTPRPASIFDTDFPGFSSPGYISVFKVIGNFMYGLIASSRNPGFDEPFCFNVHDGTFTPVLNILSSNVPTSPATTGDWVPPTMDDMGVILAVTHPGFNGTASAPGNGFYGWFDLTNLVTPIWHSGNLQVNGSIQALGTLVGGSGYGDNTYNPVALTGGSGSGATAVIIVFGGTVTQVYILDWGKDYLNTDVLSATFGGGSGFTIAVAQVALNGAIQMTTPPTWVAQFNERLWFGINPVVTVSSTQVESLFIPSLIFTDILALNCTNANQALTFGNSLPLVAGHGLGLSNQLGGIIQSLMVFQDDSNVVQITGDAALNTLAVNSLNVAVGTIAPRSIASSPVGIFFLAQDGLRIIGFDANISPPIGLAGTGVVVPFENILFPTRANSACDGVVFRISIQRADAPGNPWQEFWFDLTRKVWSGPHSFPSTMIDVFEDRFVLAPEGVPGELFTSTVIPDVNSIFRENGTNLSWIAQTVVIANNMEQGVSEIQEFTVNLGILPGANQWTLDVLDANSIPLPYGTVSRVIDPTPNTPAPYWIGPPAMWPYRHDFPGPVIYVRAAIRLSGPSCTGFRIGDIYFRRRALGYIDNIVDNQTFVNIACFATPPPPPTGFQVIIEDDCCHTYFSTDPFTTWDETDSPPGTEDDIWIDMVMAVNDGDYTTILPVDQGSAGDYGSVVITTPPTFASGTQLFYSPGTAGHKSSSISAAMTAAGATILIPTLFDTGATYLPYLSTDSGATWIRPTGGLPSGLPGWLGAAFSASAAIMYLQRQTGKLWKSTDGGSTWTEIATSPFIDIVAGERSFRIRCSQNGQAIGLLDVNNANLYCSNDGGATWTTTAITSVLGQIDYGMSLDGSKLFYTAIQSGNVVGYTSTNNGSSWTKILDMAPGDPFNFNGAFLCGNVSPDGTGFVTVYQTDLVVAGNTIGEATISIDSGATWTQYQFPLLVLTGGGIGLFVSAYIVPISSSSGSSGTFDVATFG